jgi:cytosine/adenosine deaminase-related metal-dependent hydrolase
VPPDTVVADQRRPVHADGSETRTRCSLRLRGARVTVDAHSAIVADVEINHGRIQSINPSSGCVQYQSRLDPETADIDLAGYLLLPGLINAHDHLEFSLFPKLGHGPYQNAEDWAKDIYHPDSSPIREHLDVPKPIRLWWGGIRNLLCGVTTVCHHNEFRADVFEDGFPIRVLKRYAWSHSLLLGGDITAAFRASDPQTPYIIHLGEGVDSASTAEVFEIDRMGLLDPRTVIVHGVALDDAGHDLLVRGGSALIWCPGSNLFTLGMTLSPERIRQSPRIALGSDSALTAGDLLDQIAIASELGVPAEQLFALVTTHAADVLKLQDGEGALHAGSIADIIAIPDSGLSPADTLVRTTTDQIELVLSAGIPHLFSIQMFSRFPVEFHSGLDALCVEGTERYVRAPVTQLLEETKKRLVGAVKLGGKQVQA